ncbi:arginine-ornithine antiporter [Pediococcus pentosaceus]|uniref:arginine-ornithine antiporter n=1 Tax=Pediococcus pentosaceus TaxID=1255 RepID=UPI001F57A038|nr:arginine-ornithine antiporter [Pediococcus pentosaceus]MCI2961178.1 arginine-ornithine antiporter [Pediococcus pentosaceus]
MTEKNGKIGLLTLSALVISSSIGSGVFGIMSDLARAAAPGPVLITWFIVGLGVMMLALSLNNLLLKEPELEGIFSYPKKGFGPFMGFISGWGYWLSAWLGSVAFATFLMSTIGYFFPILRSERNLPLILIASIFSWGLTYLVNRGIEGAAIINTIVTVCKLIPLFVFIVFGIILFKGGMFTHAFWNNMNNNFVGGDVIGQVKNCMMVMMWVFVGIEGASILSARAEKKSDAGRATILGLISLLVIYILASVLPYGYLTQEQLATIKQPAMLYIFEKMVGTWGGYFIGIGLIVSILGAWLSWTMLPAETMLLMAKQKLLPEYFGKINDKKAPTFALILTAGLIQIFLFTLFFTTKAYNFAYSLCTAAVIVCYILVAAYQIKYSWTHIHEKGNQQQLVIGVLALLFEVIGILMAGLSYLLLCFIAYIPGIYFYGRARKNNGHEYFLSKGELIVTVFITIGALIGMGLVIMGKIIV